MELVIFFIAAAVLLLLSRILARCAQACGLPSVVGELSAGIILGPSVLGHVIALWAPTVSPIGFPRSLFASCASVALAILMLRAGMEVRVSTMQRHGRQAALTTIVGFALPFFVGFCFGWLLPEIYVVGNRIRFALVVGSILSISALPVISRILTELRLTTSSVGAVILTAAMFDDLLGWGVFSVISGNVPRLPAPYLVVVAIAGAWAAVSALRRVGKSPGSANATWRVSLQMLLATLLAAAGAWMAESVGCHAALGAFCAGITVGHKKVLGPEALAKLDFAVDRLSGPLFFGTMGLFIDFTQHFDAALVTTFVMVACLCKVLGCALGAKLGGMARRDCWTVGFAMNARGAMGIVIASTALAGGLIGEDVFVALVTVALATSIMAGPLLVWTRQHRQPLDEKATAPRITKWGSFG